MIAEIVIGVVLTSNMFMHFLKLLAVGYEKEVVIVGSDLN